MSSAQLPSPSHLSISQLEAIKEFPSQPSSIQNGQYAIKHEDEGLEEGDKNSGEVHSKVWFKSPPLDSATIRRIDRLQLIAESHDQGGADEPLKGNWTWFEIAILASEKDREPRVKDGVKLVWTSHYNWFLKSNYNLAEGAVFDANHDLVRLLENGNVIAVRLCARFPAWQIFARNGYLVLEIGPEKEKKDMKPVEYAQMVSEIKNIQEIITEVNDYLLPADSYKPTLSKQAFRADVLTSDGSPPLRVLSLDGGGARGLSSLHLLKAVMDRAAPTKKPCEIFDMIGGTSTGGLIAIMLGRLEMTVQECIDFYNDVMAKIFIPGQWKNTRIVTKGEAYDSNTLETIIKDLIRKRLGSDDHLLLDENKHCKVFVMAVREDASNNRGPIFLRSYQNPHKMSDIPEVKIWEAARATSAAPSFFKSIKVGKYTLVDGGLGNNNPLGWLWYELFFIFGAARSTSCFLSIGTGIPKNEAIKISPSIISSLSSVATNTEIVHILFRTLINAYAPTAMYNKYWRLNVGEEIGEWDEKHKSWFSKEWTEHHLDNYKDVGEMDDVTTLPKLIEMTMEYVKVQDGIIGECAERLRGAL